MSYHRDVTREVRRTLRALTAAAIVLASFAIGHLRAEQIAQCMAGTPSKSCMLTEFNRPHNWLPPGRRNQSNVFPAAVGSTDPARLAQIWAINSAAAKVIYSGTVISVPYTDPVPITRDNYSKSCAGSDWKVVLLSKESSNVISYGPADISELCATHIKTTDLQGNQVDGPGVLLVVPVTVVWAEVFRYKGNTDDPLRKETGKVSASSYCGTKLPEPGSAGLLPEPVQPTGSAAGGIEPCDVHKHPFWYEEPAGSVFNYLTQPGTTQGTISFTPVIATLPCEPKPPSQPPPTNCTPPPSTDKTKEALTFDVQLYPSGQLGPGWIGLPIVFEKSISTTGSLNSLTAAISYDIPFSKNKPQYIAPQGPDDRILAIRWPDFRIQYGPEFAPGSQICGGTTNEGHCGLPAPHDLNMVAAATLRLPVLLNVHQQPSAFSLFPVVGLEGGSHVTTRLDEPDPILRKVAGFDSSVRIPFILTHQFLGDKPMTIDFAWRTRYLSYREPFTDYVSGVYEVLTKQQRSFWRGSFIVPVSTYVQFKVTVLHGGLPPDFDYLGYSVNVGLTFGNPGYSEH